jgi:purine-binding chemotaxis protein CheW
MSASQESSSTPEAGAVVNVAALRFRERVRSRVGGSKLLVFEVGGERFAVELQAVDEVVESPVMHSLPDAPQGLLGVFTFRGVLLPLFSPAMVLGLEARRADVALVMRSGARRIALAVDEVDEVRSVAFAELRDAPITVNADELVAGLLWSDGEIVAVLDARALVGACSHLSAPSVA